MNRLKELRKEKKLTQKELADIIDVSKITVLRWENDERQIKPDKAEALADYFGVSVGYLLGYTDNSKIYNDEKTLVLSDSSLFSWSYERIKEESEQYTYNEFIHFFRDNRIVLSDNVIDSLYKLIKSQDIGWNQKDKNLESIHFNAFFHSTSSTYEEKLLNLSQNGYSYMFSKDYQRDKLDYLIHRYILSETDKKEDKEKLLKILVENYGERPEYEKDYRNGI